MTLYTSYAEGHFAVSDRVHSVHDLTLSEYLKLRDDFNSGRFNAADLFEAARVRHVEAA